MIRERLTSIPVLVGLGVWMAVLALYLATVAPTLTWGYALTGVDGGELLAAANTWGVPHPPGYPTYTVLLKAFATIVPVGDFAFRGNILSAVFGSISAVLLYWVILRFLRCLRPESPAAVSVASAALGATTFAATPLFWSQAIITEVYTLNALFATALVLIASHIALRPPEEDGQPVPGITGRLALFGLLLGLGLGNHLSLLAVAVPMGYWIFTGTGWRKLVSPWPVGALLLGLGIYVYLPVSAAQHPPVNWGHANTLDGFAWMITGQAYQDYVFGVPVDSLLERVVTWLELAFRQLNPLGIFFGLVGWAMLRVEVPRFAWLSLLSIAILGVYSITYNTVDAEVLTIPAFLLFSVWIGVGFTHVITGISTMLLGAWVWTKEGVVGILAARPVLVLSIVAFGALPVTSAILNYESQNLRGDDKAYRYARNVVDSLPEGSVLLSNEENRVFSLWYLRYVDEPSLDLATIAVPLLQFDWYWRDIQERFPERLPEEPETDITNALKSIVRHNEDRTGVFFTFFDASLGAEFELESRGTIFEAKLKTGR